MFEAITVCVNYPDFLEQTLPDNMQQFDKYIVVTDYEDKETQKLCRHFGVECYPTDVMYKDKAPFAKGRAINFGLGFLKKTDWICHLDADIWLPFHTKYWLNALPLDEDCFYGMDRSMCKGWKNWRNFRDRDRKDISLTQWSDTWRIVPPPFPLGARLVIEEVGGYVPIGFFQLWHSKHNRRYPLNHSTAERTDVMMPLQWPSKNRRLIPEIIAVHLESDYSGMGKNWEGRKTPRFGPEKENKKNKEYL